MGSESCAGRDVLYEEMARRKGDAGFRIFDKGVDGLTPAEPRKAYYPVYGFQPPGNGEVLGFDLGSDPALLSILEKAQDSGEPAAIGTTRDVRGLNNPSDFFIVLPVYQKRRLLSVADRREALRGFVMGALRIDRILSTIPAGTGREGFTVELLDLPVDRPECRAIGGQIRRKEHSVLEIPPASSMSFLSDEVLLGKGMGHKDLSGH